MSLLALFKLCLWKWEYTIWNSITYLPKESTVYINIFEKFGETITNGVGEKIIDSMANKFFHFE